MYKGLLKITFACILCPTEKYVLTLYYVAILLKVRAKERWRKLGARFWIQEEKERHFCFFFISLFPKKRRVCKHVCLLEISEGFHTITSLNSRIIYVACLSGERTPIVLFCVFFVTLVCSSKLSTVDITLAWARETHNLLI